MTALPDFEAFERRTSTRVEIRRPAVLRFGGETFEVALENLTRDGCRIACTEDLPPFADVSIGLAGVGHAPGRLVWRSATSYGCAFDTALPPGAVTAATLNNVAMFHPAGEASPAVTSDDAKYPLAARIATVAGLSAMLWSGVIGIALLLT